MHVKILKTVRQHWVSVTFLDKRESEGGVLDFRSEMGGVQGVAEE